MEGFNKAKAREELKLIQDLKCKKRGFCKCTDSEKKCPAAQGLGDLVVGCFRQSWRSRLMGTFKLYPGKVSPASRAK